MTFDATSLAHRSAELLAELRAGTPLVQNITNFVAMDVSANVLLALGAAPAMIHAAEEAGEFVPHASALVVNIGTLSKDFVVGADIAASAAHMHAKPWVLDPVGVGATKFRDDTVRQLLRHRPSVIRGNASEIMSVARLAGLKSETKGPRGVDSVNTTTEATEAAIWLAKNNSCVVAATGEFDLVTDGVRTARLANGTVLMTRVTALGCALSSVVAAFCALTDDKFEATIAALSVYAIAGEMAEEYANRPGSFRVAFIDALDAIDADAIKTRLRLLP